jgi:2,4-dienoyl-CoA reductase-like NADH-dependent reductase (Old Yellow Enzyme family)
VTEFEESAVLAADYDITPLLQPLRIRGLQLRNRFVMPGMQRYWCVDGAPDYRLREYYRRRVLGGASLVISESCAIDHPSATKNPTFARISPGTREAWRACVAGVHEAGGAMFLQLWHQGAVNYGGDADSDPNFVALSPSGVAHPGESFGRAATEAELASLKRAFVQGALDAAEIGADGVELHSAHGFLLDQFLWPGTNLRTDRYGGQAITGRATFVAEVAEAVRAATGPGFVISVRISQWKESDFDAKIVEEPGQLGELVGLLRAAGADIFHVSTRRFWTPEWDGSDLGLAGWAKSFTDAAVIAVGSVGLDVDVMASLAGQEGRPTGASRIGELVRRFQRGDFDLVSVGRSQIGDPDWVTKMTDHRIPDIRGFRADDTALSHDVVTTLRTTLRPGGIPGDTVDEHAGDLAGRLAARVCRP